MSQHHFSGVESANIDNKTRTASRSVWVSLGTAVLSVLHTLSDKRGDGFAAPDYGRGPLILDFA